MPSLILGGSSANSLNNFNSVKSKKFQTHTRKLIQIALELLLKSQVPAVQYIALTTINRLFDIYVYHGLFYPGYYESCYIPLSKRKSSSSTAVTHLPSQNPTAAVKAVDDKKDKVTSSGGGAGGDSEKTAAVAGQDKSEQEVKKSGKMGGDLTNLGSSVNNSKAGYAGIDQDYCSCVRPPSKKSVEYRVKGIV
jgi:hypothetical protein